MSEFSKFSEESNLKEEENVLDLIIHKGEFDKASLVQALDGEAIAEEAMHSFLSIEFYDHDTKTTDMTEGFRPLYSTQFAFKNKVDDYYLAYLDRKLAKVELFVNLKNRA